MPHDIRGGHETHWRQFGHGPRAALMIHCSLASSGAWAGVAEHFKDDLTMTAFDLPSHGKSARWDRRGDLQDLTMAMAKDFWTAQAGEEAPVLDGPVDVIGHSFGATVALRLAVEHPEKIRSLTMIEPVYFAIYYADDPDARAEHEAQNAEYRAAVARGDDAAAAKAFVGAWGDGRPWDSLAPEARARMIEQIHTISAVAPAIYDDRPGMIASGALERLDLPVLLIDGAQSSPHIATINEGLKRRIKGAQRVQVQGGHMAPITDPAPVAQALRAHLFGGS